MKSSTSVALFTGCGVRGTTRQSSTSSHQAKRDHTKTVLSFVLTRRVQQVRSPTQLCRINAPDMIQWRRKQSSSKPPHSVAHWRAGQPAASPAMQKANAAETRLHQPRTGILRISNNTWSVQVLKEAASDKGTRSALCEEEQSSLCGW